jgi:hypothetical protein
VRRIDHHPIFVGFKPDGSLRRQLESLSGPDKKYVSADEATFLSLCKLGDDVYVGKVIEEPLTTDRVDDVRRNVLSILRRLCPDTRLPEQMRILSCPPEEAAEEAAEAKEKPSFEGL